MFGSGQVGKAKDNLYCFVTNVALIEYSLVNLFLLGAKALVYEMTSLEVNESLRKLSEIN